MMSDRFAAFPCIRRLGPHDAALAAALFARMAEVFDEPAQALPPAYLEALLASDAFWALAAVVDDQPVAGLTAHVLPMTRDAGRELFVYDVAVVPAWQRRGVGRALLDGLRARAAGAGIGCAFVAVDIDDAHALAFYRAAGGTPVPTTLFLLEGAGD